MCLSLFFLNLKVASIFDHEVSSQEFYSEYHLTTCTTKFQVDCRSQLKFNLQVFKLEAVIGATSKNNFCLYLCLYCSLVRFKFLCKTLFLLFELGSHSVGTHLEWACELPVDCLEFLYSHSASWVREGSLEYPPGVMFTHRKLVTGTWAILQPDCGCHAAAIFDSFYSHGCAATFIAITIFNNHSFDSLSNKQTARTIGKDQAKISGLANI